MLDTLRPYPLYFIQKASPGNGDAFDLSYIYKFYSERTERYQRLKCMKGSWKKCNHKSAPCRVRFLVSSPVLGSFRYISAW